MFLENQIGILEQFLKDPVRLKKRLFHHRNKIDFRIYYNRKQRFLILISFHNITAFTVFKKINLALMSIKYSLQKDLKKYLTNPAFLHSNIIIKN